MIKPNKEAKFTEMPLLIGGPPGDWDAFGMSCVPWRRGCAEHSDWLVGWLVGGWVGWLVVQAMWLKHFAHAMGWLIGENV
jgi:hypothetical protein